MALTVAGLIGGARALFNDRYDNNFANDDISDQVDGTNQRFKLQNRNLVGVSQGAPANPALYYNNNLVSTTVFNAATGIVTIASPPGAGGDLKGEYFFTLCTDAEYTLWATDAANFVGSTDPTQVADGLASCLHNYMAAMAAEKMSDMSGWYYQAAAGNKNFNKDQISAKFLAIYKEKMATAEKLRDDFYKRHGQREAPAKAVTNFRGVERYTPRR